MQPYINYKKAFTFVFYIHLTLSKCHHQILQLKTQKDRSTSYPVCPILLLFSLFSLDWNSQTSVCIMHHLGCLLKVIGMIVNVFNIYQELNTSHIYQLIFSSEQPCKIKYGYAISQERMWNYKEILSIAQSLTLCKACN